MRRITLRAGPRVFDLVRAYEVAVDDVVVAIADLVAARALLRPLLGEPGNLAPLRAFAATVVDPRSDGEVLERVASGLAGGQWRLCERRPRVQQAYGAAAAADEPTAPEAPGPTSMVRWFEVEVLDEVGEPIADVEVEFLCGGVARRIRSNGAGVAHLDHEGDSRTAGVRITDPDGVRATLQPRWQQARTGAPPRGDDVTRLPLRGAGKGVVVDAERRRTLVLVPSLVAVRLRGLYFEHDRTFLLPGALRGIHRLCEIHDEVPGARLVITGHADASGSADHNLALSLARARSIHAFLTDDVDAWDACFEPGGAVGKRWGTRELQHMLAALPSCEEPHLKDPVDGIEGPRTRAAVEAFQVALGLPVSGEVDDTTRKVLIAAYMATDGTSLPVGVEVRDHGCGEWFPAGDAAAARDHRRVEIFLFDGPVDPPWPGPHASASSRAYPTWRDRAITTHVLDADEHACHTSKISVLLRSNSGCVPLAGRPYRLVVDGAVLEGITGDDGSLEHRGLPAGDHTIIVEDRASLVATRPADAAPVRHVIAGFHLFAPE